MRNRKESITMEENLDHEWIKLNNPGAAEHSCTCKSCQAMCKHCPCLGTPDDILKIIKAGFADKLEGTTWLAGLKYGQGPIYMVQPLQNKNGRCAFLDKDDLCKLHNLGLKPIEGKLSSHKVGSDRLAYVVARTWLFKRNNEIIDQIVDELEKNKNNPNQ